MKKLLSISILIILATGLIAPSAVLAQKEKLKECCTIHQDMVWKSGMVCLDADTATTGNCKDNGPGPNKETDCAKGPDYCKLTKDKRIGAKGLTACPTPAKPDEKVNSFSNDQWGMICLINTITYLTNWIFYLMMIAVVVVFVIAAAWFMMAGGDPEKTSKAKGMMTLGIVGLVIALVAKLIPSVVKLIIGM